jgi:hypothetical protein
MSLQFLGDDIIRHKFRVVMPALVAGIHVFPSEQTQRRGWPEEVRP